MKHRFFLCSLFSLLFFSTCSSQAEIEFKKQATHLTTLDMVNRNHLMPLQIDSSYARKVYFEYLKQCDYNKQFLTASDVSHLSKYAVLLENHILTGSNEMVKEMHALLSVRIQEAESWVKEILDKPLDFSAAESVELDPEKRTFAADAAELKNYWRKMLKSQVLNRLYTVRTNEKNQTDEENARKHVYENYQNIFRRIGRTTETDRFNTYLNAMLKIHDPHTAYLAPKDKKDFDIAISGQLEGIGAMLEEKNSQTKVVSIVPGSASWKQGDLKAGDIILKVAQGKSEPVDIFNMDIDEVVQLIRGKKGTEVRLTVKKLDGTLMEIPIIRDLVIIEETYARSAVIEKTDNSIRFGYINLLSFYASMEGERRSCSYDVYKEIEILKRSGIKGLILDLRNNGGGYLEEAVRLAGLFISEGPIVQVKAQHGMPAVYRDPDPAIRYDGQLIVMVNESSASASEIVAAAIQDYRRGIIMGSTQTFGKGTVQNIASLDNDSGRQFRQFHPLGHVKVTIQKFYRINGGATQLRGVEPDIVMPSLYDQIDFGEKDLDHCIPWSEITPTRYQPFDNGAVFNTAIYLSAERIKQSSFFAKIKEAAAELKTQQDDTLVPLERTDYFNRRSSMEKKSEEKSWTNVPSPHFRLFASDPEGLKKSIDTNAVQKTADWHSNLIKDIYLEEAVLVLQDLQRMQ